MSLTASIMAALEASASPNQAIRQQGEAQLQQHKQSAGAFYAACADILIAPTAAMYGRQLAGFQIKNNMSDPNCAVNPQMQSAVCGAALLDPEGNIRKVASSIVSLAVRENVWPAESVVPNLCQILTQRQTELPAVHGAMRALSQVVDDCVLLLEVRNMIPPLVQAVQPYLTATHLGTDPNALEIRVKAFDVMATILERAGMDFECIAHHSMRGCILPLIEDFFSNLSSPPSERIATKSVLCLVLSLTFHEVITDELFNRILQLMYQATTSPVTGADEQLRIEATEFWRAILHFPRFTELAAPAMPTLIPVLIQAMVYSAMEMGMLQGSAQDWSTPDKLDDIRPRHYQARVHATNDEDGEDDDEEVEEWNLRRVSALSLDSISEFYGERVLLPVLGVVDGMMQPDQSWKQQEAAILALGAICDGCFHSLTPYLPDISSRLLQLLENAGTHFLVVNTVLWTGTQIGRYFANEPANLQRFMTGVLNKMQSPSKLTQEAASAALETMVELCEDGQLNSMAGTIVECVAQCLRGYQLKNRVLLFEVLETICSTLGAALRDSPAAVEALMAPLAEIWTSTPNDSPLLFSFFRCMGSVCCALGPTMQSMAKTIFDRGYGMLSYHVQLRSAAVRAKEDPPEPEFLITSADLLSGLFDAMGSSLEPLVTAQQPTFMNVVLAMLIDESPEIRQSGFSLVGDVAKACPTHVQANLQPFCEAVLRNLDELNEFTYSVISNVAWSVCNLLENQMDINNLPTIGRAGNLAAQMFAHFAKIFCCSGVDADMRNMEENIALCLGMLLYHDPDVEATSGCGVAVISRRFCEYVRNIKELQQKDMAVNGYLIAVQRAGPHVVLEHLTFFFDLAASLTTAGPDTQRTIKEILQQAKLAGGVQWHEKFSGYNEQMRNRLYQVYGVN